MKRLASLLSLAAIASLVACDDSRAPTSPGTRPSPTANASISDGANHGGNDDFFFLPPMVKSPVNDPHYQANQFNGGLKAKVVICLLGAAASDGSRQCASDFKVFNPDQISVSLTGQQYQVNWDTKSPALNDNAYYRVQVFVGSTVLGHADVDPVSNGSQLKNVDTQEYIGLVDGRTLPIKFRIENGALCESKDCSETYVSDAGGLAKTNTGFAAASFPQGWLPDEFKDKQVLVTIDRKPFTSESKCHPATAGLKQFEGCYIFKTDPHVGTFKAKVRAEVCTTVLSTDPEYHALQLFSSGPDEPLRALEDAEAPDINCADFAGTQVGATSRNSAFELASAGFHAIERGLGSILGVKRAYAIHLGLGGLPPGFSNIGWGVLDDLQLLNSDFSATTGATVPVTVRVVRNHGEESDGEGGESRIPVEGATVSFVASAGTVAASATTGPLGYATVQWTLGSTPGTETLAISSSDASGSFTLTAIAVGAIRVGGFDSPRDRAPLTSTTASTLLAALQDQTRFGAEGPVACVADLKPFVQTVSSGSLVNATGQRTLDVFFAGLTAQTLSDEEATELASFVTHGGVLYISGNSGANEGPSYTPLFQKFGTTPGIADRYGSDNEILGQNSIPSSDPPDVAPLTNGPFGAVGPLRHSPFRPIRVSSLVGSAFGGKNSTELTTEYILAVGRSGVFGTGMLVATGDPLYFDIFTGVDDDNLNLFLNLFAAQCPPSN